MRKFRRRLRTLFSDVPPYSLLHWSHWLCCSVWAPCSSPSSSLPDWRHGGGVQRAEEAAGAGEQLQVCMEGVSGGVPGGVPVIRHVGLGRRGHVRLCAPLLDCGLLWSSPGTVRDTRAAFELLLSNLAEHLWLCVRLSARLTIVLCCTVPKRPRTCDCGC